MNLIKNSILMTSHSFVGKPGNHSKDNIFIPSCGRRCLQRVFLDKVHGFLIDWSVLGTVSINKKSLLGFSAHAISVNKLFQDFRIASFESFTIGLLEIFSNMRSNINTNFINKSGNTNRETCSFAQLVHLLWVHTFLEQSDGFRQGGSQDSGCVKPRSITHHNHNFALFQTNFYSRLLGLHVGLVNRDLSNTSSHEAGSEDTQSFGRIVWLPKLVLFTFRLSVEQADQAFGSH